MRHRFARHIGFAAALFFLWCAPAAAQSTTSEISQKAAEAGRAIQGYAVEKKDDAVKHAKRLAADIDAGIHDLEAHARTKAGEAKTKADALLKDLKARRAMASRKLDELAKASKSSWEQAKTGFADAYRDLASALERATADIKK